MKTNTCLQCGNEFRLRFTVNGKETNIEHRKICLECKPIDTTQLGNRNRNLKLKEQNKKQCGRCNTIKEITDFYPIRKSSTNYHSVCKDCKNEQNKKRRQQISIFVKDNLACSNCGYNKCIDALDFHHRNPNEKEYSISKLLSSGGSLYRIKQEILKCDVLCANCHREEHWRLKQNDVE